MGKKKIYIDTCVFISYLMEEQNENPYFLFQKILENKFEIVFSQILFKEFKKKGTELNILEDIKKLIEKIKKICKYENIHYDEEDLKKAKKLNIHFPDNLHIILAKKSNCDYLITYDKEYFNFQNILKIKNPKEFD